MARKTQTNPRLLEVYRIIGDNISRRRGTKKMSKKKLAEISGVSRSTIIGAEDGLGCSLEKLTMIAGALGCEVQDLFVTEKDREEISYKQVLFWKKMSETLSNKIKQ
jgi:transcriptional regulator with XRE-family HTH domain